MTEDVRYPLAALYWDLHARRSSGRVRVSEGDRQIELVFWRGRPVSARSSAGAASPPDAAIAHAERLLMASLAMQAPVVSFEPGEGPRPELSAEPTDFFELLRDGVAREVDPATVAEALHPFSAQCVIPTPRLFEALRARRLTADERRVLHAVDGRTAIGELARRSGLALHGVLRIVYVAWCTRAIRFQSEPDDAPSADSEGTAWLPQGPPAAPAPPGAAAPPGASPPAAPPPVSPAARISSAVRRTPDLDAAHEQAVTRALALDGYFSRGVIGRGGWGTVYRAYHERLDRMVAVKVPARELLRDDEARERFILEARNAGRLMHPNVVIVHDCNSRDGILYLVMELLEGRTTKQIVERGGALPARAALGIARAVAVALEHAHGKDVLHRDVKPDNVFVSQTGDVKLADWGLAAVFGGTLRQADDARPLGTPAYMSPEQIRSEPLDRTTDIYSFGALLHFLVTGKPPYEARSMVDLIQQQLLAPAPDARRVDERISAALAGVIWVAMAKEPAHRYQSVAEIIAAIDELLAQ